MTPENILTFLKTPNNGELPLWVKLWHLESNPSWKYIVAAIEGYASLVSKQKDARIAELEKEVVDLEYKRDENNFRMVELEKEVERLRGEVGDAYRKGWDDHGTAFKEISNNL